MINATALQDKIKESGYKIGYLCDSLGLSRQGFWKKANGQSEFKASEIKTLSELLKLTADEQVYIFFC